MPQVLHCHSERGSFCHPRFSTSADLNGFVLFQVFHCHSQGGSASSQVCHSHLLVWIHVVPDFLPPLPGVVLCHPISLLLTE